MSDISVLRIMHNMVLLDNSCRKWPLLRGLGGVPTYRSELLFLTRGATCSEKGASEIAP